LSILGKYTHSDDWRKEKHVPVVTAPENVGKSEKFKVELEVGKDISHPNTTEHHIRWLKLWYQPQDGKFVYELGSYEFNAHGESVDGPNKGPALTEPRISTWVSLTEPGILIAQAYCNIHGLWEGEQNISVE
jgi:superoxide reductase